MVRVPSITLSASSLVLALWVLGCAEGGGLLTTSDGDASDAGDGVDFPAIDFGEPDRGDDHDLADGDPAVDVDVDAEPDASDAGDLPDADVSPPSPRAPGFGLTAGGGQVASPRFRLTISVGGPSPAQTVRSPRYSAHVGVGAPLAPKEPFR